MIPAAPARERKPLSHRNGRRAGAVTANAASRRRCPLRSLAWGTLLLCASAWPWRGAAAASAADASSVTPAAASPLLYNRLGPLRTHVSFVHGPTLPRGGSAPLLVSLCNGDTRAVAGEVELLATAAWQGNPPRRLPFRFETASACTTFVLDLVLPEDASPGPYDCVLRLSVGGNDLGTLRTRVIRPIEWIVVGPFAPAPAAVLLPPERGINLEKILPGLNGEVRWRRVPAAAYDATGTLEMDVVFGAPTTPQCACALTVFDLVTRERLHWTSTGAERLLLDGGLLEAGQPMRLAPGPHTLVARSCTDGGVWRLGLSLRRDDGDWPRQIDNDLARLLPGFDGAVAVQDEATHRHVTLAVREPAARQVQVLGTFNAWVPWPLERGPGGTWRRDLVLAPGRYAYKLRVDGRLQHDPSATRREPDGFGGANSLLVVP